MRIRLRTACLVFLYSASFRSLARSFPHLDGPDHHTIVHHPDQSLRLEARAGLGGSIDLEVLESNRIPSEAEQLGYEAVPGLLPNGSIDLAALSLHGNQEADVGDYTAFSNSEIPGIVPGPTPWRATDGTQLPLFQLDQSAQNGLWAEALVLGTKLKANLDNYVGQSVDRVASNPPPDINIDYQVSTREDFEAEKTVEQVQYPFLQAGFNVNGNAGFDALGVFSKTLPRGVTAEPHKGVLVYGVDAPDGIVISLTAFAVNDGTDESQRLKSSELLWQSWRDYAPTQGGSPRGLRVFLRHNCVNQEGNNLLTLAHLKHPENVNRIPLGIDSKPLPPTAGHGLWRPPTSPNDGPGSVWTRLLNSPNVKAIVHMLTDHNTELDNPYLTEIHTFPMVKGSRNVGDGDIRWTTMVLVLGKMPVPLVASASSDRVEEGTAGVG